MSTVQEAFYGGATAGELDYGRDVDQFPRTKNPYDAATDRLAYNAWEDGYNRAYNLCDAEAHIDQLTPDQFNAVTGPDMEDE